MAALLKLVEQVAQAAAQHAAGGAAGEQAAQTALQQIAETAAAQTTGRRRCIARRWRRTALRRAGCRRNA